MESYHKSSWELLESGKTVAELEGSPWWDPTEMAIVDTGQTFDDWDTRRRRFERWHYVQGLGQFFETTVKKHGWITALETLFDAERWEEISHILDENNIWLLLRKWDLPLLKKKLIRAKNNGLITPAELLLINQIFNGS